jgi:hypothetical protein
MLPVLPFLLAAALFVIGLAVTIFSFFTKSVLFRSLSVVSLVVYSVITVLLALVYTVVTGEPEWNPDIKTDQEVFGIWADQNHKLQLNSSHYYTYQNNGTTTSGVWDRDDWNLYLKPNANVPDDSSTTFRFIEYKGHLRVLTHEMGDPDSWDGDVGLPKE